MSANTIKKAKALAKDGMVKVEEDLYQVKSSSDAAKSYFVTLET